jgi:hypothetical protein
MDRINDPQVYLLTDDERQLVEGGPALIGPDGTRYEVPVRVFEAMQQVESVLRSGRAVQITPLDPELSIAQAADVIDMRPDTLRSHVEKGEIPHRKTEYTTFVRLADVLEFDRRLRAVRREALGNILNDPAFDQDDEDATRTDTDR